jgi:hypothetical protein
MALGNAAELRSESRNNLKNYRIDVVGSFTNRPNRSKGKMGRYVMNDLWQRLACIVCHDELNVRVSALRAAYSNDKQAWLADGLSIRRNVSVSEIKVERIPRTIYGAEGLIGVPETGGGPFYP